MKRTFLNAEDAYRAIEEALNFLEEQGEKPFRGMTSFGHSWWGYRGKSGSVRKVENTWKYEHASEFPKVEDK